MTKVAVVGAGYWGKNLIRTFNNLHVLKAVYDLSDNVLNNYKNDPVFSGVAFGNDYTCCLDDEEVLGVVIATPPSTHYAIAKACLLKGKHVFIEKPMTLDVESSKDLLLLAEKYNRIIMVGHIFLYSPEIIKLKEVITSEAFGDVRYIYTRRLNLGKIQECGVIMDLAPHDVSIIDYLLDKKCRCVKAVTDSNIIEGVEDVAFISMRYDDILVNLHLSWLDPLKVRDTVVVGTKQMAVCDSGSKKIDVYNNSVDVVARERLSNRSYADHLLSYKYGDVVSPYIESNEPMAEEAKTFLNAIKTGESPLADGNLGLSVVSTVVAMKASSLDDGRSVYI